MWEKIVKSNKLLIIILVSLLIIGAVILANFLSFSNIEDLIISQLKDNQLTETEHAASQIETHIMQVKDELVTLSKFPLMEALDISDCSGNMKIIYEKIEGKIDSLLRVDKDGNIVECSSLQFSDYLGINIRNKDYFKVPKETNEPFIAGMVRQGANQQIIIAAPLFETKSYTPYPNFIGEFKGILFSIIEVNNLYNLYLHPILDDEKNIFLLINLDTEETIIKSNRIDEYSEIKDYFSRIEDHLDIIAEFNGFGSTIITSSDLVLGSEIWRLIILTPLKNVGAEVASVQQRHLFSLVFVIVVIVAIFLFLISIYKSKEEVQLKLEKTNVTLEKLGIKIEVEKDKYNQADISLDTGKVYLVKEEDENHAHELFISSLNKGFAGLGIVRENPGILKKKYDLHKTSFIWLSKAKVDDMPSETNIDNLYELISEFIKKSKSSVVLLDRLDYILSENNPEDVIRKIRALKDFIHGYKSIIIISANPDLINESELKVIESESVDLYGKHLRKKVELSDMEMDILEYINGRNIINRLASYKDITENFKITKPTTRVKINKLSGLGLINVEQKGRFKSLKITSAGRKIV